MNEIELADEERERHAAAVALEQESFEDLNDGERFDTVEIEEEDPQRDEFGQPLQVLAITEKVKRAVGTTKIAKMERCGNIRCYLHDKRGVPRVTIGPNWPFATVLLIYAVLITYMHFRAFHALYEYHAGWYIIAFGICLYSIGIWGLLHTFFGDPGIPEEIFVRYSDPTQVLDGPEGDDEEEVAVTAPTTDWCSKCLVPTGPGQVHCTICNVCIRGLDHHCIFFGKCIGAGNVGSFRVVISMAVVSTLYAGAMYGWFMMQNVNAKFQQHGKM